MSVITTPRNGTRAQENRFDVIIAGGGPAGSTAAALLAEKGHRVLLIEREMHPRFHIGESMLPLSEPIMERLGIDWSEGNLFKGGAEFVDEAENRRMYFPLSGRHKTYQIERSRFDERLFRHAAARGVETREGEKVLNVRTDSDAVQVSTDRDVVQGRYFIDATGRSALMGRREAGIARIENLGRFALYTHFRNVRAPAADRLFESGNVVVLTVDLGWLWVIPLAGRRLSVGLVVQKKRTAGTNNTDLFHRYVDRSPLLRGALEGADQEWPVRAEADFSFVNQARCGLRYACVGDAAGFLDPVFSSGVFLAFSSAQRVADRVHLALQEEREDDPLLHREDDRDYERGFRTMHLIVERFYGSDLVHNLFFEADRDPAIKNDIARILAGDLWSEDNAFQHSLLQSRRGR